MQFVTINVVYKYPHTGEEFLKQYTVMADEPFPYAAAEKQWRKDETIPHEHVALVGSHLGKQDPEHPLVQLPIGFTETRYPGYFWNVHRKALYSLKGGTLRELQKVKPNAFNQKSESGYSVSHLGKPRWLPMSELRALVEVRACIPLATVQKRHGSRWS